MTPAAPGPAAARRALTGLALVVILTAAVVVQLTVVNRLPLPAAYPDLVLLAVIAIAVCTGPLPGTLAGFAGGLALDIAPPASHYAGEYALVFCLAGYAAARAVRALYDLTGERDPIALFTVMAVAAAAGEAGKAALGLLLSDPDVTGPAIRQVLPAAILYDLLLAPLMFLLVARLTRDADPQRAPAPEFSRGQRIASVFRLASTGAAPDLRLSGTGADYRPAAVSHRVPKLRLDGTGADRRSPALPRRVADLRLSGGGGSRGSGGSALSPRSAFRPAGEGSPSLTFAAARPGRSARPRVHAPGRHWLRAAATAKVTAAGAGAGGRRPARRAPAAAAFRGTRRSRAVRSGAAGPAGRGLGRGWIRPAAAGVTAAGRAPQVPARGWLRPANPAAGRAPRVPARGWLRPSGPAAWRARRVPARGWLRPSGAAGRSAAIASAGGGLARPRSGADVLAARSAPSGLSALAGAGTPAARRPRRASWLRSAPPSWTRSSGPRLAPRSGWLGGTRRPRTVIGSTPGGRRRGNWYTAAPSRDWARRSRSQWPGRRQRLLRLVGVGR